MLKMSQEQSERRTLEAERRLEELIQGQAITEQEAQKAVEAQHDLDDVKQQLNDAKTQNLVNTFLFFPSVCVYVYFYFVPVKM